MTANGAIDDEQWLAALQLNREDAILKALNEGKKPAEIALLIGLSDYRVRKVISSTDVLRQAWRTQGQRRDAIIFAALRAKKSDEEIGDLVALGGRQLRHVISSSPALRQARDELRAESRTIREVAQHASTENYAARTDRMLCWVGEGLSHAAIAKRLGVSTQRVQQIVSANAVLRVASEEARRGRRQRRNDEAKTQLEARARTRSQAKRELEDRREQTLLPAIAAGKTLAELGVIVALSRLGVRRFIYSRPELKQAWLAHAKQGGRFAVGRPKNTPADDARAAQRFLALFDGIRKGHTLETLAAQIDLSPGRTRDLIVFDPELRNAWADARPLRLAVRRQAREDAKAQQDSQGGNP